MVAERDLGPQPIGELLMRHGLRPTDLVAASDEQVTHKMVARAVKGRRLTPRVMRKVLNALNTASGESYELADLFDYGPETEPRMPDDRDRSVRADAEGSYTCPSCGEEIVVPVTFDDSRAEYVEDCPVCCSPVLLRVNVGDQGDVRIEARAE
jgi:DNA-directed RNA polymerase subunit RPC12/RpoP